MSLALETCWSDMRTSFTSLLLSLTVGLLPACPASEKKLAKAPGEGTAEAAKKTTPGAPSEPAATAPVAKPTPVAATEAPAGFVDVTQKARIHFSHHTMPGTGHAAPQFQMNHYVHGSGVACGDADGDGLIDLYLLDQRGPNLLYRNMGGFLFQDITAAAGVGFPDRVSTAAAFADLDRDGDQDLLVAGVRKGIAVARNDGTARFDDVSSSSGLTVHAGHVTAVGLIDGDGDGLLDIFAGHNAIFSEEKAGKNSPYHPGLPSTMGFQAAAEASHYYRNLGGLRFEESSEKAGFSFQDWEGGQSMPNPKRMFWTGDAVVTDFEPDGKPDLAIANMAGFDRYYRNLGNGRFEDVTYKLTPKTPFGSFGLAVIDADQDGRLDLVSADMHSDMFLAPHRDLYSVKWNIKHNQLPAARHPMAAAKALFGNALFRNPPEGQWQELSDQAGIENLMPWGVLAADFDLDGDEDLFFPAGMGWPWQWSPDFFYLNRGNGSFEEAADRLGLVLPADKRQLGENVPLVVPPSKHTKGGSAPRAHVVSSRAAVACDLDSDGDQDLVVVRWDGPAHVYENRLPASGARPLVLELKGTHANPDAVGARVTLRAAGKLQTRIVPGTTGYLSAPDRRLYFGIPAGAKVESIEIQWPFGALQKLNVSALVPRPAPHLITQPKG